MTASTFEECAGAYLATVDHDKSDDWVAGFIAAIVWARGHDAKVRAEERERCSQVARSSSEFTVSRMSDGYNSVHLHGVPMNEWIADKILEREN